MNAPEASAPRAQRIADFIERWSPGGAAHALNEEQGAQQHFIELCALLGVAPPAGGDDYLFEKGALLLGQRRGYADVFKRGCFAWENKAPGKPLDAALRQLMGYALALDNPPLLIVSDRLRFEIHTHFNGTPSECHRVHIAELADPAQRELLRRCFDAPDSFRPQRSSRQITEDAARAFATTAERLRAAGVAPDVTSHLLTQCLFCFFAEDIGLLPGRLFERLLANRDADADALRRGLVSLFTTMRDGGLFGADSIARFNGGLFARIEVPPLSAFDVAALRSAAALDWSAIDASIFGTLFERGLDPAKRAQLGAHYTDPATIERLIDPVLRRPLRAEWGEAKAKIAAHMARHKRTGDAEYRKGEAVFVAYLERLRAFRVLDPACGSGNFLYLALMALKDLEHQANLEAETLGLQRQVDAYTSPANVLGIELNEYAAELARVTVWIGELQWRLQHGYPFKLNPVLDPLDQIECRDALMHADGSRAAWPKVDVVVGNPPFVGDKKMRAELGHDYTERLRKAYAPRVPGGADLVCYWFDKARAAIEAGTLQRAGLVATNSIRGGRNRQVLDAIVKTTRIFEAWSDEPWVNDGAAVRVSLVAFGGCDAATWLDGQPMAGIGADLAALHAQGAAVDLTAAASLRENAGTSFSGIQKTGPFELPGEAARAWLKLPNPHGRANSDVVRPWFNGLDVTRRLRDMWIVDFGAERDMADAALYEAPFEFVSLHVKPTRVGKREARTNERYWLFQWSRPVMRGAIAGLRRFTVTPEVAKHRVFAWLDAAAVADKNLVVIARADDTTFGILHSRLHELWSLRLGTSLEDRPRYTPTTCFETFAFPPGLTPADTAHQRTELLADGASIPADLPPAVRAKAAAIACAAKRLNELRERWLNPPEWTRRESEVVPLGMDHSPYPDRIVPREGFDKQLAQRTLTKLYNERPAWLAQAHEVLDAAVAAAYGWADYSAQMPDDEILRRLLALNRERAA
ncbi:MAG TPA: N-6 DNA methylase [Rubrivivax sp.]|nr:N-6 DNA methylase [Rubrivivax sp.]